MNNIKLRYIYDRKKKLLKDGTALVQLRIHCHYQTKYHSTGIYLTPDQWKAGQVVGHRMANRYNIKLNQLLISAEGYFLDQQRSGHQPTAEDVQRHLAGGSGQDFYIWLDGHIEKEGKKQSTSNMRQAVRFLRAYRPRLRAANLNYRFIVDFEQYLNRQTKSNGEYYSKNYIAKILVMLKMIVKAARRQGVIKTDPFELFSVKMEKTKRATVTIDEIALLKSVDMSAYTDKKKSNVLAFLFACYTSLRFSDVVPGYDPAAGLRVKHIVNTPTGWRLQKQIFKNRKRKPEFYDLNLDILYSGAALDILRPLLKGKKPDDFIFERVTSGTYQKHIRAAAEQAGIKAHLTSHSARKSAAQNLLDSGASKELVQSLLNHSTVQTTEVYANKMRVTAFDKQLKDHFNKN